MSRRRPRPGHWKPCRLIIPSQQPKAAARKQWHGGPDAVIPLADRLATQVAMVDALQDHRELHRRERSVEGERTQVASGGDGVLLREFAGGEESGRRGEPGCDCDTVLRSLRRTNRLVIAHEAVVDFGVGAELAALAAREGFWSLDAPVVRVGAGYSPAPYAPVLEQRWRAGAADIARVVREVAAC